MSTGVRVRFDRTLRIYIVTVRDRGGKRLSTRSFTNRDDAYAYAEARNGGPLRRAKEKRGLSYVALFRCPGSRAWCMKRGRVACSGKTPTSSFTQWPTKALALAEAKRWLRAEGGGTLYVLGEKTVLKV